VSLFGFISTFLVFGARLCEPQHDRTLKVQPFLNALCLVTLLRVAGPRSGRDGFGKFGHYPKLITLRKAEGRGPGSGELAFLYLSADNRNSYSCVVINPEGAQIQMPTARDQPLRLFERFVHALAVGQDHPYQRVHASSVDQSKGASVRSGRLTRPRRRAGWMGSGAISSSRPPASAEFTAQDHRVMPQSNHSGDLSLFRLPEVQLNI